MGAPRKKGQDEPSSQGLVLPFTRDPDNQKKGGRGVPGHDCCRRRRSVSCASQIPWL